MTTTHHLATLAASAVPSVGAIACLLAVAVMLILDRIPLSAYRPRGDHGHSPRHRRRRRARGEVDDVRDDAPVTTVRRLDQPAITARRARCRELEGR